MKKLNSHVWLFDQCEIHQCEIATIDPVDHSMVRFCFGHIGSSNHSMVY